VTIYFQIAIKTQYICTNYKLILPSIIQGGSNKTGTDCGLFTYKSVPVIFEPPSIIRAVYDLKGATTDKEIGKLLLEDFSFWYTGI